MYHHREHDSRLVSPRTIAARRHLLGLARRHMSTSVYATSRHERVCLDDRKWNNFSNEASNATCVSYRRRDMSFAVLHAGTHCLLTVHITAYLPFLTVLAASYRSAPVVTPCPVQSHLDFLRRAQGKSTQQRKILKPPR